jgi:predicted dehydrogenase
MSLPIRTAVIGYGFAGRIFHSPFIAAVPGLELAAIVQRHGDTAAADYPDVKILRSPAEAFSDKSIDLIVVATPNESHFGLAHAALQAGKHVVVDKPFAATSAEALKLIASANQQGRILAPFHNRRFDSDFLTLGKLIAKGTLGRVSQVISHYDRYRPVQRTGTWKEAAGTCNGLLFDLGPHLIDQALALFGTPKFITASVRSDRDVTAIDDAFDIALDFGLPKDRGLRYVCSSTMIAAEPAPRFRVHGTHGSFLKFGLDPQEAALLAGERPPRTGSTSAWLPEPESAWGTLAIAPNPAEPTKINRTRLPSEVGDYRLFYESVRNTILGQAPLAIPAEDGYRTIRLLELALQSSQERRSVPVAFAGVH